MSLQVQRQETVKQTKDKNMYKIYRTITGFSEPVLSMIMKSRLKKGKESPQRYTEKFGISSKERPSGNIIWIHGASIGESQSALILLKRISEIHPDIHFLITTGTLTSAKLMEQNLPPNALHQFFPLDHPNYIQKFLKHWKPDMVLWMESELWPNALREIKQRNIPALLINARMSKRSMATWRLFPSMIKKMLNSFDKILCQSEQNLDNYKKLGALNAVDTGNIKYAASPLKCDKDELRRLLNTTHNRPIWLYASTHHDEESIACEVHERLKQLYPDILTIIVPRHPDRRDSIIEATAKFKSLKIELRSTQIKKTPSKNTDIYIVDTLGELGLFYRLSPISCIGRSFSKDGGGGHNPIEAAQLGSAVLHGPNVQNLQDIYDDMDANNISIQTDTPDILASTLTDLLGNRAKLEQIQNTSVKYSRSKSQVIENILKHIVPILEQIEANNTPSDTYETIDAV